MKRPVSHAMPATSLLQATVLGAAMMSALAAMPAHAAPGTSGYSMTPNAPSDIYVQGKYDRSGIYVPPHYIPKTKAAFSAFNNRDTKKHGYFDLRKAGRAPQ